MLLKVFLGAICVLTLMACSKAPESDSELSSTAHKALAPGAEPNFDQAVLAGDLHNTTGVQVSGAYMYALAPGQAHGAVYLQLTNTGEAERQVVDISTPVAGTSMVHRTFYEEGVMRMRHMHHVKLAPQQTLVFEPNGYHIMLMDMESVPPAGGTFPVTVSLDQNQTITFDVAVKNRT